MGCSGSKTAAKAQAAPAAPPAETLGTEGDFKINLENPTSDADLGLVVNCPEKKYILVESIKEAGLVPSWNKTNENTPEMQVKAGDFIVAINGKFGDSDAMMAECKAQSVSLAVKRAPQAAAPAAEAPLAEATATAAPAAEEPAAEPPAAEAPVAEVAAADAPADAAAAEAEAPELPAEAPVNAKAAAAVTSPDSCLEDASVSVEPEATEVGASTSESRMCGC
jgi:hypothetical protein